MGDKILISSGSAVKIQIEIFFRIIWSTPDKAITTHVIPLFDE